MSHGCWSVALLVIVILPMPAFALASDTRPLAELSEIGPSVPDAAAADYFIGAGDLLEVTVFEEESLNRTVRVSPEGVISLPLLGSIQTAGRSVGSLESEIGRLLSEHFLFNPQVSVFVKEYRSRRVSVLGAINSPGSYELLGQRTLLELISEAGGLTAKSGKEAFVFSTAADGSMGRARIDLDRLMREGDPAENLRVREGSIIHVPEAAPLAVYVYGAVGQPGMIEARATEGLTLLQAITRAGGVGQRAALDRITIMREEKDGRLRLRANLRRIIKGQDEDPILRASDVVVVPESFF